MRVNLSADLPSDAKNSSERERAERGRLGSRMRDARDALQTLGVPFDAIDITPATAYSTAAHGQIVAMVRQRTAVPSPGPLVPSPQGVLPSPAIPPAPAAGLPSLDLDFTFGPVTVSLPKEVRAKLPIALAGREEARDRPGLRGAGEVLAEDHARRYAARAGVAQGRRRSRPEEHLGDRVGRTADRDHVDHLQCARPRGDAREDQGRGDKLNKAAKEFETATGTDKLGKAFDIAGAIGEMYDAVDKAKARCKQVPRATVELGYKRLLTPGSETDPTKLPPTDYVGITGTFRF